MKIHDLEQGSQEWHDLRATHFTASNAPTIMGASKYKSRSAYLKELVSGEKKEISDFTQSIFDRGHEAEALARPLAEDILGETLFPAVMTNEVEGLPLLASFDGINMAGDTTWEHKLYNVRLIEMVKYGMLDAHYLWQIAQGFLVSGASKCMFMTSDGNLNQMDYMWIDLKYIEEHLGGDWENQLIAAWKAFKAELESSVKPIEIHADDETDAKLEEYLAVNAQIKELEGQAKELKEWLETPAILLGVDTITGTRATIATLTRKVSIEYKDIPELKGINLEAYRKPDTKFFTIKEVKQ